ncbi:HlyD family efflux transporter periplasmic adaptor subunit [Massilia violaceinigra]|uniref:HlyD family efflux transporter periplasmic adaptor subunit n=1 Tax=Massilia violaceinigra TaxID=2045208 RepID=A0ABY4ACS1_9BURK|nr:HlyD family efflux transporter periplasmic adaptor subunit [Massilia violaceinigra]UOD32605.1 HlyD family efflux transporter periplasmic adaptor subunit [Massilia violaceinigra]
MPDPSSPAQAEPSPPRPLFRLQALEHAGARQYGQVILARAPGQRTLTILFAALALAIVAFFFCFSTTRKAQSQGLLLPTGGVIRVIPGRVGVIMERRVREGQQVAAGDVLFVLSGKRTIAAAGSTEQTVAALLHQRRDSYRAELGKVIAQAAQRSGAARRRVDDIGAELARVVEQIALQEDRLALAREAFGRYEGLARTNYISPNQLSDKRAELLDQRQRLAELVRIKTVTERAASEARAQMQDIAPQADRERAALERSMRALEQDLAENQAQSDIVLRAPIDGVLTALGGDIGQTVTPETGLGAILPAGAQLEAEIYVPSRLIGFIKPGMAVSLRYPAFPYQKFGQHTARVRDVADTSSRPADTALASTGAAEPMYRLRLTLERQSVQAYGKPVPLKSGMLVDASIALDHRRLYEWVLEPLFTISGR